MVSKRDVAKFVPPEIAKSDLVREWVRFQTVISYSDKSAGLLVTSFSIGPFGISARITNTKCTRQTRAAQDNRAADTSDDLPAQ